jgi:hypothetical protein
VSSFGLDQLASTAAVQLAGPADTTDFLAYYGGAAELWRDPAHLYDTAVHQALQRGLQGGRDAYVPFVSPPHVPLVQAPLGLLPYGVSYAAWLGLGVLCLAGAAYLVAPRPAGRHSWLVWLVGAPLFVPVLFGLVMGQWSCLMLLGFCAFARLVAAGRPVGGGLALVAWTAKPNLLPVFVLSLLAGRGWRSLVALVASASTLLALALLVVGPAGAAGFIYSSLTRVQVAATRDGGYPEGVTLLTVTQDLLGIGPTATLVAIAGGLAIWAVVAELWRGGLRPDARSRLQLAILPVAATLASLHAGVYELTTWLATVWLLLAHARQVPAARPVVYASAVVIWCSGTLAVVGETTALLPVVTCAHLAVFAAIVWLYLRCGPGFRPGAAAASRANRPIRMAWQGSRRPGSARPIRRRLVPR